MINTIIKLILILYFCLAALTLNKVMADENGTYYYRLNKGIIQSINIPKGSLASGTIFNWGNCSGKTQKELNQKFEECDIIINENIGFTGTTEICVDTIGNPILNNSYCFSDCLSSIVNWSAGLCTGELLSAEHNDSQVLINTNNQYAGNATFICEDGLWLEQTSNCAMNENENDPLCGSETGLTFGDCKEGIGNYVSPVGDPTVKWTCTNQSLIVNCSKTARIGNSGICGSTNGQIITDKPSTNLCLSGTPTYVTTTLMYTWSCEGESASQTNTKGLTENCSATRTAVCSSTSSFQDCTLGVPSDYTSLLTDNFSRWNCVNGNSVIPCNKLKLAGDVNGKCGSSHGTNTNNAPSDNLCLTGKETTVLKGSTEYTWSCTGNEPTHTRRKGVDINCSAKINPICDNNTYRGCEVGAASSITSVIGASTVTWNCTNGSETIACSKESKEGVSGICGSDNVQIKNSTPTNLCDKGTSTSVQLISGKYTWNCNGESATLTSTKGQDVSCSSDKEAVCDTTTFKSCLVGDASEYTSNNSDITATWNCTNHSSVVNCTKNKATGVSGQCGSNNGATLVNEPTNNLCNQGIQSTVIITENSYNWSCEGLNASETHLKGDTVSCSANKVKLASCDNETFGNCIQGASLYKSAIGAETVEWTCTSGESIANCSKTSRVGIAGTCGQSHGEILTGKPTTNLCITGTPSFVNTTTMYTWTCKGETASITNTTGITENCNATRKAVCSSTSSFQDCTLGVPSDYTSLLSDNFSRWNCVNGISVVACSKLKSPANLHGNCGTSNGLTMDTAPTINLCSSGTSTNVIIESDKYIWNCLGNEATHTRMGGSNKSCSAIRTAQATAVCDNTTFGACTQGTSLYTSDFGANTVTWNCTSGGSTVSCSKLADTGTDGSCGSANGETFTSAPSSQLCSNGTASSVSKGTNYSWTCSGSEATQTTIAGSPANCSANIQVDTGCKYDNNNYIKIEEEDYSGGDYGTGQNAYFQYTEYWVYNGVTVFEKVEEWNSRNPQNDRNYELGSMSGYSEGANVIYNVGGGGAGGPSGGTIESYICKN